MKSVQLQFMISVFLGRSASKRSGENKAEIPAESSKTIGSISY